MNILLVVTHLNYGGIGTYIISLARALKKQGNNVFIASSGGEAEGVLKSSGITCINIPMRTKCEISPKVLISYFKLKKEIKRCNIDIIHSHTRVSQVLGFFLSRKFNLAHVSTCHGFFKRRLSRRLLPAWGDKIIAISEAVAKHLEYDFKVKKERITIIHNGIDPNKFINSEGEDKERIRKELDLPLEGHVVGMIARLSEVKGHKFFISSIPLILNKFPKAIFLIVGEGRLEQALRDQVDRLKIRESVFFIPTQNQTARMLSLLDCFVAPSVQEGLGLSIMEAQAAGVPVVAFAVGGITSLIEHERTGILVKPKDIQELAKGIIHILEDQDLASRIKANARENVKANFTIDRMTQQTLRLYSQVKKDQDRE